MKFLDRIKPWGMSALLVLLLLWGTTLHAAVPGTWKDTGFSINASNMTLRGVLDEFSHTYGVRLSLSADGDRMVRNRLKADNGVDFLNRLAATYKFRWFVYNDTLYVVPVSDNTSMRMAVGEDAVQDAKAALVGLGLFDERFGWGELPDEGVVIVSGPRAYVDLARGVLMPDEAEKQARRKGKQIMLFRLKYASAMDRVITTRGKSETIPGIKTILSNLLFGSRASGGENVSGNSSQFDAGSRKRSRTAKLDSGSTREVSNDKFVPLFSAPAGNGKNQLQDEDADISASHSSNNSASEERPRIEADPTLNAIMIYDDIKKKEMYASLITQLDIQPQQIEIEALIVDIDRSKLSELGVQWSARNSSSSDGTSSSGTFSDSSSTSTLPGSTLLISNLSRFTTRLKAMEASGNAHVLATPTVLTLDNVAAVLDLSQSAYVSLVGERVADMSDVTAGTMLRVIPRIIHEGNQTRVRLEVDIEDGSLDNSNSNSSSSSTGTNIAASVTRSTISTQAIIDMQQTLMIGGYRAESLARYKQKVPVLGDLPLVGGLFRSESQSNSTRERLFLITPRITGTDGMVASSATPAADRAKPAKDVRPGVQAGSDAEQNVPAKAEDNATKDGKAGSAVAATNATNATGAASTATPAVTNPAATSTAAATPAGALPVVASASEVTVPAMGSGVHVPLRAKAMSCTRSKGIGML